jgi:hypothetical protein
MVPYDRRVLLVLTPKAMTAAFIPWQFSERKPSLLGGSHALAMPVLRAPCHLKRATAFGWQARIESAHAHRGPNKER